MTFENGVPIFNGTSCFIFGNVANFFTGLASLQLCLFRDVQYLSIELSDYLRFENTSIKCK